MPMDREKTEKEMVTELKRDEKWKTNRNSKKRRL